MVQRITTKTVVAAGGAVALALAGCGSDSDGTDASGEIELEFVTWQLEEPGIQDWWNEVIAEFEDQNPDATVVPRHVDSTDVAEFVTNRFAADSAPQILHLPTEIFPVFADEGWLEPIDNRLADTDILENWPDAQTLMEWDGSTQGLMVFGYPVQLYYNDALLADAGQDVPTNPDELVSVAEALTGGDIFGFGTVTTQHRDLFRQVSSHVVGFGSSWTDGGAYELADPGTLAALENFRQVSAYSPQGVDSAQKRELFMQGKVAMMLDGPFLIPTIADAAPDVVDEVKVARAPFENVSYYPANGLHIPSTASDQEKDLAWEFIELSASPDMQDRFVELYQSPAARAGVGADADVSPLLAEFISASAESVSIIPDSASVRAEFGTFDRIVQDGLMEMITSDGDIAEIFTSVEDGLIGEGIEP